MTVSPRMMGTMTTSTVDLSPLPKLDTDAITAEESAAVRASGKRLRSPQKLVGIYAGIAADAEKDADALRPRRNELLMWLRARATENGVRNLGLPDAMGLMYTRAWTIVNKLEQEIDPDDVDPGTAPVGEFRDLAERVYRAERRRDEAVKRRDEQIVKLHEQGLPRRQIHELAGGVFDPSLISQIVKRSKGR